MPGDDRTVRPDGPLREAPSPACLRPHVGDRRGLLGRLDGLLDYAAPVAFGAGTWLAACGLTRLLTWTKTNPEDANTELDLFG